MYICDELRYIKKFNATVDNSNKKILTLLNDFYVNKDFSGENPNYCLTNRMLYDKFQAFLWQERGEETEDLALSCEPYDLGIDPELMSDLYPLKSQSWLLFYGITESDDSDKIEYQALLLPEYNQPKVTGLSPSDVGNYKAEFFFYHDNDYIMYLKQCYGIDHIAIEVYRRNMQPHQTIKLYVEGWSDHSYARVVLSPNGRYLCIVEEDVDLVCEEYKKEDEPDAIPKAPAIMKIKEIMMDKTSKKFTLEDRRQITDCLQRYDKSASEINQYTYYGGITLFLTDKMEVFALDKSTNLLMYEEVKCYNEVEKKFGKDEYDKEKDVDLNNINIVMKNGGFAFYNQEEVFFLRVNSDLGTVLPLVKINFKINKGQMTIDKVCPCSDPALIVISFIKGSDYLLLVWNVEENKEVYNFSTSEIWSFMLGPNNKAGYIMNGETYVNLDKGLINYFFEYKFTNSGFYEQNSVGYRINQCKLYFYNLISTRLNSWERKYYYKRDSDWGCCLRWTHLWIKWNYRREY